jgi:hypothetical protein
VKGVDICYEIRRSRESEGVIASLLGCNAVWAVFSCRMLVPGCKSGQH